MRNAFIAAILIVISCVAMAQQPPAPAQHKDQPPPAPPQAPDTTKPKRIVADVASFELDPKKAKPQGMQIGAGSRGGAGVPPPLYAPNLGKAYSLRPVFSWGESAGAQQFTFRLYDSEDEETYEQAVPGNLRSFTYPADAPALKAGATYSWTVQALASQLVEPPEPVRIQLISGADRQAVEQALVALRGDSPSNRRKRAQIFVDHRLWYDAVDAYTQLISENRDNADLYSERADIYAQLPETQTLANLDKQQANKLQGGLH